MLLRDELVIAYKASSFAEVGISSGMDESIYERESRRMMKLVMLVRYA